MKFRTAGPCHPHLPHCWVQRWWLPAEECAQAQLTFFVAILLASSLALLWSQLVFLLFPRLFRLFLWTGRSHILCFTGRGRRGELVLHLRGTITGLRLHQGDRDSSHPYEPGPVSFTPSLDVHLASDPHYHHRASVAQTRWHKAEFITGGDGTQDDPHTPQDDPNTPQDTHLFKGIQQITYCLLLVQLLHPSFLLWHRHGDWEERQEGERQEPSQSPVP